MKPENRNIRPEKESIMAELQDRVSGALYMILADYHGLNMPQTDELKKSLREKEASYNVVSNRLMRRALNTEVPADLLSGPTVMISGDGDVVEVAKIIRTFSKKNKKPVVKGGILEGKMITADEVGQLAQLPAKQVLQAQLLGTLMAPCSQLVGVMHQKVASLVYVLNAVREKKEQEA
ncbi:MAG: 50S ribosomal protein L10 [Kiritimatiellales bacterium]|nr:50S ribosomal protein L10 [Kiritimatiellales bacterium]